MDRGPPAKIARLAAEKEEEQQRMREKRPYTYSFLRHIMRAGKYMLSRVKRAGIKILGEETATDANLSIPAFRTRRVVGLEALLHFVRRQRGGGEVGIPRTSKSPEWYVWSRRRRRRRIPAYNFKSPPLKNATVFLVPSAYFFRCYFRPISGRSLSLCRMGRGPEEGYTAHNKRGRGDYSDNAGEMRRGWMETFLFEQEREMVSQKDTGGKGG